MIFMRKESITDYPLRKSLLNVGFFFWYPIFFVYYSCFHDIIFSKNKLNNIVRRFVLKKRIISIVCLFLLISLLPGCSSDKEEESDAIIVNDQIGRQITIKDQVKRVVSTSYITTSTCLALGVNDQLVGIEKKLLLEAFIKRLILIY